MLRNSRGGEALARGGDAPCPVGKNFELQLAPLSAVAGQLFAPSDGSIQGRPAGAPCRDTHCTRYFQFIPRSFTVGDVALMKEGVKISGWRKATMNKDDAM
jgi:hypothetical protein